VAKIEIGRNEGAHAISRQRTLEVTVDNSKIALDFELLSYRHLDLETQQRGHKFNKVVLVRWMQRQADGSTVYAYQKPSDLQNWEQERKVVRDNGNSCRPYYESLKGQRLRWAKEDPTKG